MPTNNTQNQVSDFKWAYGPEGVRSSNVLPGHTEHFFDREKLMFYVKAVDYNGYPMELKAFEFKEVPFPSSNQTIPENVVTMDVLNETLDKKFDEFMKKLNQNRRPKNSRPKNKNYREYPAYEEEGDDE